MSLVFSQRVPQMLSARHIYRINKQIIDAVISCHEDITPDEIRDIGSIIILYETRNSLIDDESTKINELVTSTYAYVGACYYHAFGRAPETHKDIACSISLRNLAKMNMSPLQVQYAMAVRALYLVSPEFVKKCFGFD